MKTFSFFALMVYWSIIILAPVLSKEFKIDAKIIGHVEKSNQNTLVLESEDETIEY